MSKQRLLKGVAVAALGAVVGCTDLPSTEPSPEDTGRVEFALVVVPTDVQCISITATGTRVRQQDFIVVPSQTSVLAMNGLPVGPVTFSGQAFNGPCGSGPMGPMPTYVADPVTAQVNSTGVTALTLNMRRNGQASISVDFETGGMCGPVGSACSPTAPNACCTGLTCQADPTGITSCQPQTMCAPQGTQCAGATMCCSGLACQPDAAGTLSCLPLLTCRPPGAMCGPGLTQQCCAGLMCVVDPAAGTAICQ